MPDDETSSRELLHHNKPNNDFLIWVVQTHREINFNQIFKYFN